MSINAFYGLPIRVLAIVVYNPKLAKVWAESELARQTGEMSEMDAVTDLPDGVGPPSPPPSHKPIKKKRGRPPMNLEQKLAHSNMMKTRWKKKKRRAGK